MAPTIVSAAAKDRKECTLAGKRHQMHVLDSLYALLGEEEAVDFTSAAGSLVRAG